MRGANPLLPKKDLVIEVLVERLHACVLIGGTSGWRMAKTFGPCGSGYTTSGSYGGKLGIAFGQCCT